MARWRAEVREVRTYFVDVEADDEDRAWELADEKFMRGLWDAEGFEEHEVVGLSHLE